MDIEDLIFPREAFLAPPPFDEGSPGDCYLQSSEGTTFKVLRHVLIHSSRYFERLFEGLPPSRPRDLPKLHVEEDAPTLHALLIILYPVHEDATKIGIEHTLKLIEIQDKYNIPGSAMTFFLTSIIGINVQKARDGLIDDPTGLYSLAWRIGFQLEAQLFSHHLHGIDLNDEKVAGELVRNSNSLKAYIALSDLRRRREAALDDIIEALEPRKHFCVAHSGSDMMFFAFISLMKNASRNALVAPWPQVNEGGAISFLGLQSEDESRAVAWCSSCYAGVDMRRLSDRLQKAVEKYPQEITM
ncbi:hypothetical protein M407DRAFT_24060 [Tulasnella calospora MUT 4182]|uniref:BTB domain-containing protein n=1 Tax=Tulasnella calospora MUT 4182 TaxID=1051891 RepID=A0A0C3QJZ9_9AGAM|nr:hypothetical protein M407DRAFT_24060 [Tulasnella calospora MUT 4182]